MNEYFPIRLGDFSLPSICDGESIYFGTKDDLLNYYIGVRQVRSHNMDLNNLYSFINQESKKISMLKFRGYYLNEKITLLGKTKTQLNIKEWTHINIWGFDYHIKINSGETNVIWIKHNRKYYRCIQPSFENLQYTGDKQNKYLKITHFWGQPGFFQIDGNIIKSNLFTIDKQFDNKQELLEDIKNFDANTINLTVAMNEVFGDG